MSTQILICFISGLLWACFDLTRKLSLNHISPKIFLLLFMFIQMFFFLIWCIYDSFYFYFDLYLIPGFFSAITGILGGLIFLKSLKESHISLTIPLLSVTPLFSSIFSWVFLDEELSSIEYLGILAIIFGILILYSDTFRLKSIFNSFLNIKNNLSAKLMILVAFLWSLVPVFDKMCLDHSSINIHGLVQSILIFIILLFFSLKDIKDLTTLKKSNYKLIFLTTLIGISAVVMQFISISITFVPIMEAIKRATGQFGALIFGKIFFNEGITEQKVSGIIIISAGVFMLI